MKLRLQLNIFWWLHPVPAVLLALVPFLVSGHLLTGVDYKDLWRTEKYLDKETALITAAILAAFLLGAFCSTIFRRRNLPHDTALNYARLKTLFLLSFAATTLGYIIWAIVCFTNGVGPAQVLAVIRGDTGAVYAIRDLGATVAGVTTATQFGMATGIFGAMLWNHRPSRTIGFILVLLILMAMVRALLWSERLATIEVLIPLLIALFGRRDWYSHPRVRRLLGFAPLLGCAGLYFYFTVSESFRSWGHYSEEGGSLWYFSWMRLCGYYITALNNGALMHKVVGTLPFPYTAMEFFWKFPGISVVLPYNDLFSVDPYAYLDSLKAMANPEFNNPSGIFPYVLDFGPIGACVFWFLAGWMCTACYSGFQRGTLTGVLCFPLLYVSLLEISRIPYLTSSRTLPSWAMLFLGIMVLKARPPRWRSSEDRELRTGAAVDILEDRSATGISP